MRCSGRLISVNVAVVQTGPWTGRMGRTGIDKRPSETPVMAGAVGLDGDTVVDTRYHGGADRAAYAYALEDAAWWSEILGRAVTPGAFGENLTTEGINITSALIGEQWRIGEAVFEVSGPRIPCRVFSNFWGVPNLIQQFVHATRPGAYLRVLTEGRIRAGDDIGVLQKPKHDITVGETFRALTLEPAMLPRLRGATELPREVMDRVLRRLDSVIGNE